MSVTVDRRIDRDDVWPARSALFPRVFVFFIIKRAVINCRVNSFNGRKATKKNRYRWARTEDWWVTRANAEYLQTYGGRWITNTSIIVYQRPATDRERQSRICRLESDNFRASERRGRNPHAHWKMSTVQRSTVRRDGPRCELARDNTVGKKTSEPYMKTANENTGEFVIGYY